VPTGAIARGWAVQRRRPPRCVSAGERGSRWVMERVRKNARRPADLAGSPDTFAGLPGRTRTGDL